MQIEFLIEVLFIDRLSTSPTLSKKKKNEYCTISYEKETPNKFLQIFADQRIFSQISPKRTPDNMRSSRLYHEAPANQCSKIGNCSRGNDLINLLTLRLEINQKTLIVSQC